ncbi:FG-GAP repeat domain-containing protein [Streptomyces sp. NPDC048603]|uniref:FG-GAP repeat domain-containing protein n=1 Tax=Streptomyces sp. NPDC048603 TaxID=3365577 RepID=UPI0037219FD8
MSSSRSKRLGRIAACTALAVVAGTLLSAGPASGAPLESSTTPGKSTFASKPAKPRLDLDGDGRSDVIFRTSRGPAYAVLTSTNAHVGTATGYTLNGQDKEVFRDIVALGNIRGGWGTEVLQWSRDGRLSLHQAYKGGTQAPTWTGTGWNIYNKLIAAGDLTKDGRGDLLARTPSGDLYLYRATGAATGNPFADRVKVGGGWGIYDQIIGANDLDADGIADLLAKDLSGNLHYYKGTGSATAPFKARTLVGGGWNAYNKIAAGDDLTGDGKADLWAITPDGTRYQYASKGNGAFSPRMNVGPGWTKADLYVNSGVTPLYGKHGVQGVDASEVVWEHSNLTNGRFDAKPAAYWENLPARMTLVNAAAVYKYGWSLRYGWDGSTLVNSAGGPIKGNFAGTNLVLGPGDLTGDGLGDLLTRDAGGTLWLRVGNGTGDWFGAPTKVGPGWGAYKSIVGGGDITGDGRTDIVTAGTEGQLYLYRGTGNATAPFGARELVGSGWNSYNGLASPGDLNGDGRADLIARDSAGDVWLFKATGHGGTKSFAARTYLDKGWNKYRQFN